MNDVAMKKSEAIALLKLSIEFGVDEALGKKPRDRLTEANTKILPARINPRHVGKKEIGFQGHIDVSSNSSGHEDEKVLAAQCADACVSVTEINKAINEFPHFKKNIKDDRLEFYQGATKPSIIILREPEIYNIQSYNDYPSCNKKLLFERIVSSLEMTLEGKVGSICGSLITFPLPFDKTQANAILNTDLLRPFLLRYISILKPKVLISMGGFRLDNCNPQDEDGTKPELFKDLLEIDFPSLDVLTRAPKRKKDIWKKILYLKKEFRW